MSTIKINMPEMAAVGLSENWLFKFAGNQHWQMMCQSLGLASHELCDDAGRRLYPSFIAIRARYDRSLLSVAENECFTVSATLNRFGQSIFASTVTLADERTQLRIELVTKFLVRETEGSNRLRQATLRPDVESRAPELDAPPAILGRHRDMRNGISEPYRIGAYEFNDGVQRDLVTDYEPSPYTDYNGAGLLYFASYPAIADTLERKIIIANKLNCRSMDWAIAAGTVARDIFYYRNLDLGESLRARLECFSVTAANGDPPGEQSKVALLHTRLLPAADGAPLAEVFTVKALT